jgi:hypothetical protein
MHLLLDILTGAAIACAAVGVGIALFMLMIRHPKGQHADRVPVSSEWWTVRVGCGVIMLSCSHWASGAAAWLLLAVGSWLLVLWNLVSWLRTRYRLTRLG